MQYLPRITTRAIGLGLFTDIGLTKLFLFATTIILLDPGSSPQAPIERIDPEVLTWFCLVWGLFFTALGGFVAGRLARGQELAHGVVLAGFSVLTSYYYGGWTLQSVEPVLWMLGVTGTFWAALTGSWLASRTHRA